jgi:flagellar protein FliJ
MARFEFGLEGVLQQRKNAEHVAQRECATAQHALVALQDKLRRLDEGVRQVSDDVRANHLTGPIDVSFITAHRRYLLSMERAAIDLARQIADAQAQVQKAQAALVESAKQRKTIEKLRDKQFERWMAGQLKRENGTLDEAGMQIAFENLSEN